MALKQFTPPPDTRAVGSGNPPADVNNLIDMAAAQGSTFNLLSTVYGTADPTGVLDSTAAFQACLTAATAQSAEMVIPPGVYKLNAGGIAFTGPVRIRGLGAALTVGGSLTPAVTLNCNGNAGSTSMFTFPFQGFLWNGLEITGIAINYTAATSGDVFHGMNVKACHFYDIAITLTGTGTSAFQTTGNVSVLNCEWERVSITTTNATRTVPMITLSSTASGSISNNTFFKCYFTNVGLDNTQYMVYIDCNAGAGAYHYMETFRECWFEQPFGGAVKSLSGMALAIESCTIWDIFSGQGQTVGNSCYYIGAFPSTGSGSQNSRIIGCSRNRNGPDGGSTWDIFCEATTCGTLVQGYTVKPDSASTTTNAFFNFNGHPDVQLIGNLSAQGAAVNGNSTTVISGPSFSSAILGAGASAGFLDILNCVGWTAMDSGYQSWNFDPAILVPAAAGTLIPTSGAVFLNRVNLRRSATITNVLIGLGTIGVTLTAGQSFAGLYNSAGTLVATTADQSANWAGATGIKTIALTGGPFPLQAGYYWVAFMSNWTGTAPSFLRAQNTSGVTNNAGVAAAFARWATNGTGTTALPGSITPSANVTTQGISWWVALS